MAEVTEKPKAAEAAEAPASSEAKAPKVKKSKRKADVQGLCTVKATFNNTIVSISDSRGNVVAWGSPGKAGFKGSRKSTPFAAQVAAEAAAQVAYEMGMRKLEVRVKGAGAGRARAEGRRHGHPVDPRRHRRPAQRLPSQEASPRLKIFPASGPGT
jgi:small subunit ribosomal protein S11